MCSYVADIARSRAPEGYSLSMELASASTSTILALKIPIDSKIKIVFHYRQCFSLVKQIKGTKTNSLIKSVLINTNS